MAMGEHPQTTRPTRRDRLAAFLQAAVLNPVLIRDLRPFVRAKRWAAIQILFLVFSTLAILPVWWAAQRAWGVGISAAPTTTGFGEIAFRTMTTVWTLVLLVVAMAATSTSVALERQKRTYESVAVTTLTAGEYVYGKVAGTTARCCLLLFTTIPLTALCVLLGGVSPGEAVETYAVLVVYLALWSSLGVFASASVQERVASAVVTAAFLIGLQVGVFALMAVPGSPFGILVPGSLVPHWGSPSLFGIPVSSWLLGLPFTALLTTLIMTGTIDALPLRQPSHSARVRVLLLALTLVLAFVGIAGLDTHPITLDSEITQGALVLIWFWAGLMVPAFASYPAPAEVRRRPLRALLEAWRPKAWLNRESRGGPSAVLAVWLVGVGAVVLALALGHLGHHGRVSFLGLSLRRAVTPLIVLPVSLVAYALATFFVTTLFRSRALAGGPVFLLVVGLNLSPAYFLNVHPPSAWAYLSPLSAVFDTPPLGWRGVLLSVSGHAGLVGLVCLGLWLVGWWNSRRDARKKEKGLALGG